MISPLAAQQLAWQVAQIYADAETRIVAIVARYASKGLDAPGWMMARLADTRRLEAEVRTVIAHLNGETPREVARAILEAHRLGDAAAMSDLRRVGLSATIEPLVSQQAVLALAAEATDQLSSTHRRILRSASDVYRSVIARAAGEGLAAAATRRTAAQAALDAFADRGISGFIDTAGRSWHLPSYAEMAMRTATGRATLQGTCDRLGAEGYDLVIVSGHTESCPLCDPWEGEILSLSGATHGYATVDEAEGAGLWHPNCGHQTGAWIPGLSTPPTVTHDPVAYAERQQQRYLERGVRHWKLREAAALDDLTTAKAAAKTREWQGRLRQFVAANDRKRLRYREQIGKAI